MAIMQSSEKKEEEKKSRKRIGGASCPAAAAERAGTKENGGELEVVSTILHFPKITKYISLDKLGIVITSKGKIRDIRYHISLLSNL